MKKRNVQHSIEMIYPLLFILIFCLCVVLVILSGSNIYKKTTAGLEENYTVRTAVPYLQQKIRECKEKNQIEILNSEEGDVLAIYSKVKEEQYATYIYQKDGYLRELFIRKTEKPSYRSGQNLVKLDRFCASKTGDFLQLSVEKDGQEEQFIIRIEEGKER